MDNGAGFGPFLDFVEQRYLKEYIAPGGSKIKFVTGRPGSGKSSVLHALAERAARCGFAVVRLSAKQVWLHDFKEVYTEIFKNTDLTHLLRRCAAQVIKEMGTDPREVPEGSTFADFLSAQGELDAITRKEIRNRLACMFLKNPMLDNNFAVACSLLCGAMLGHPTLEDMNRVLLLGWLAGDKEVKLAAVRRLGLSPSKVTKYNARHLLRSLAELHRLAGLSGLVVLVDDLEILSRSDPMDTVRYTKMRRDDAYECIRELIDEIDTLRHIFFVFAYDRVLAEDERAGLKSYQALWMRIQNEIVSDRFNSFTDIIDLDVLGRRVFTAAGLAEMSAHMDPYAQPLSIQQAQALLDNDLYAGTGLPGLVQQALTHKEENHA